MKNAFLSILLLLVAGLQMSWAQGFRVYKSDGTVAQFSLRSDSIVFYDNLGTDADFGPFTPINQCIVGTWYKSKIESVTFNEDGTTDYMDGATYEFMPYQGNIIINNASGIPISILRVYKVTDKMLVVGTLGSSSFDVLTRPKPVQLVTGITLSETQLIIPINETTQLTATVSPSYADNIGVAWSSSDESIATVDQTGKVTAKAKGTCTITCAAKDDSGTKATCAVTVVQLVTGITLSETTLTLSTGTTHTLTATVVPPTASNAGVTWSSSNESVAMVDQSGKVTAKVKGTCTITCAANDGSGTKATCDITVIQLVTSITLSETSIVLQPDETKLLTATVMPSNANNTAVVWSSNDEAVATVESNGLVVAVANGTCSITCSATDGSEVKAECQVVVTTDYGMTDGHEWVDLGLPSGTLWATSNVDVTFSGEGRGGDYYSITIGYFAWGEIWPRWSYNYDEEGYTWYNWRAYKYCKGSFNTLTKYCYQTDHGYNGFTDTLTELLPEDDAATVRWGSGWQMPSQAQLQELYNSEYTTTTWTTQNGKNGMLITSNSNGYSIFLPAEGCRHDDSYSNYGSRGEYWSRSLAHSTSSGAYNLIFESGSIGCSTANRDYGLSVRPVRKK